MAPGEPVINRRLPHQENWNDVTTARRALAGHCADRRGAEPKTPTLTPHATETQPHPNPADAYASTTP